jgi:hypothetical protein
VRRAGIGHIEYFDDITGDPLPHPISRWVFQGTAQFTLMAFSSEQRDMLLDEVIKVLAFGEETIDPARSGFRTSLSSQPYIGITPDYDELAISGMSETPGTPWGTDDMVYEATLSLEIGSGDFVSDEVTGEVLLISNIEVYEQVEGQPAPDIPGDDDETGWQPYPTTIPEPGDPEVSP